MKKVISLRKQRPNNVYTWVYKISACNFFQCFEIWARHPHQCVMFVSWLKKCLSESLSRQEMISCHHTVFSVSFSVQSQVSVSPSHGSNDTFGFEASILALFLKSANSGCTDSLSASSRKSAFTHQK